LSAISAAVFDQNRAFHFHIAPSKAIAWQSCEKKGIKLGMETMKSATTDMQGRENIILLHVLSCPCW
jgi:hypothetical protein